VDEPEVLGPEEVPEGRAFTHPSRTRADLGALQEMAAALARLCRGRLPPGPRPLVLDAGQPGGRGHRAVLCDETRLRELTGPTLVGFFGEKRADVDPTHLNETDDALIAEFPAHPGVLSYSSLELPDGNWGNLIVLDGPPAREQWRTGSRHAYAAGELAPRHYTVIRLHRGRVDGGLRDEPRLVLEETAYHDFRGPSPWRAVRRQLHGASQ
jgi:hypothetical protein